MSTVNDLLRAIAHIGTDPERGGYSRPVYSDSELTLREWFVSEAQLRALVVETDRNGIIWAWWDLLGDDRGASRQGSVVTGAHLDSVAGGGQMHLSLPEASNPRRDVRAAQALRAQDRVGSLEVGKRADTIF